MPYTGILHIATPSDREVVLTRDFDAPRRLVFDALTKPELLKRWMEAPGRIFHLCEIDFKVGGAYHFVWRGEGKKDVGMRGVYREIVPGERIGTTEEWDDWDAGETLATTTLADQGGKTILTIVSLFPSKQVRDSVLKSGLEKGAKANYDKLDAVLGELMR
ncbi:MAG TPA: SRPBCC family protein [Gemmatimonadaceae bacterium]|nr:SRPBCC family protein [Gemmatimonadaceae bacterium]